MKAQRKVSTEKSASHISSVGLIEHDERELLTRGRHLDPQTRHRMIAESAYRMAAQRGFQGGSALEDWLAAEAEIDAQLVE
jgi:23S rRNA maturation mini-RNase III